MTAAKLPRRLPALALIAASALVLVAQGASASAATPAPVAASSITVTAATQTSITLYWTAPADPSIVGYAMYVNGTRVAGVQNIHYAFNNLKCGTSYTLSLDSYDKPQTHSPQTAITASTAPCAGTSPDASAQKPAPAPAPGSAPGSKPSPAPGTKPAPPPAPAPAPQTPPPGGVFVAPGGSDNNACSQASPCRTFDRAYHLALPGQTVRVVGGTYPAQQLTRDATKVNASSNVVFQSVAGQLAVVSGLTLADVHHVTFLGSSAGDLSAPSSGLTLRTSPSTMNTGSDLNITSCSSSVVVKDVDMHQFGIDGSDNVTIDGGTVGGYDNSGGDSHVGGPYLGRGTATCAAENPFGILITRVLFHDVQRTNLPSAHPDCLQFFGTAGTIVDGNRFANCGTSNIMARPNPGLWSGNTLDNLVIRNNSFTPATETNGAVAVLGAAPDACGNIAVLNNTSTGGLSAFSCGSYASLVVSGNVAVIPSFTCKVTLAKPNVSFSGNSNCNSNSQGTPPPPSNSSRAPAPAPAPAASAPAPAPAPASSRARSVGHSLPAVG
jgi:hypothetical protein